MANTGHARRRGAAAGLAGLAAALLLLQTAHAVAAGAAAKGAPGKKLAPVFVGHRRPAPAGPITPQIVGGAEAPEARFKHQVGMYHGGFAVSGVCTCCTAWRQARRP